MAVKVGGLIPIYAPLILPGISGCGNVSDHRSTRHIQLGSQDFQGWRMHGFSHSHMEKKDILEGKMGG